MKTLFPSCQEAARRISERQEAHLTGTARLGLQLHLALCAHCRQYARQIRLLHSFLSEYPEHLSHLQLPEVTRAEIVHKLQNLT